MIGLETHVELGTASKMFCGCSTTFGAEPNTQTCPVCLGLPGSLPVANAAAIEATIRIGLALGCRIATWCRFARKNYFYPDIPKGFQTSQYDEPLCTAGHLDVEVDGETYRVEIERVHLEEDTGKNLHVGGATGRIHGADHSLIDYNRAGIPLVEIVTRPIPGAGAKAPEVAKAYVTELREILLALGVSEVRMEQGNLRCDVNISLAPIGSLEWGTRTETKNVNSLRSVERAVRFEMRRQAAVLDEGGADRPGDPALPRGHRHAPRPGRSKEEATDYRYFPEPDLVPVAPDEEWVAKLRRRAARAARRPPRPAVATSGASRRPRWPGWSTPAPSSWSATPSPPAPRPADARKWWLGELARRANDAGTELGRAGRHPGAGGRADRADRRPAPSTTSWPARRSTACWPARAARPRSSRPAGWPSWGSPTSWSPPSTPRSRATPTSPRRCAAARCRRIGALVGAVMKTTRGKADAATVKRMLEERLVSA